MNSVCKGQKTQNILTYKKLKATLHTSAYILTLYLFARESRNYYDY